MNRITEKQLQALVDSINERMGTPMVPWTRKDGKLVANLGNWHLSWAYGGVTVNEMMNEAGGVNCPLGLGGPKRELETKLRAFIAGMQSRRAA